MTGTNWWQSLWKQLSSFLPYYSHQPGHHWMNWQLERWGKLQSGMYRTCVSVGERWSAFSVWMQVSGGVCVYAHLCVWVGVESRPALICSHRYARAAGVPVPRRLRAASFSQENAFNRSWVTGKQHRHLRDARNVPPHQRAAFGHFYICN